MSVAVLVISERIHGEIPEVTFELLGRGRALADELHGELKKKIEEKQIKNNIK
jgi:electron transfer flavoprotein alpha subunit